MDTISIIIQRTREDTEKAWLAFANSSMMGRFFRRFGFPIASIISFLLLLTQNQQSAAELFSFGHENSSAAKLIILCMLIPFSLGFGWSLFFVIKIFRQIRVLRGLHNLAPEFFGDTAISLEQDGIKIQAPLYQMQFDWKLLDSVLVTPDYLFICTGRGIRQNMFTWIPINTLGDQSANVISTVEKWLEKPRKL